MFGIKAEKNYKFNFNNMFDLFNYFGLSILNEAITSTLEENNFLEKTKDINMDTWKYIYGKYIIFLKDVMKFESDDLIKFYEELENEKDFKKYKEIFLECLGIESEKDVVAKDIVKTKEENTKSEISKVKEDVTVKESVNPKNDPKNDSVSDTAVPEKESVEDSNSEISEVKEDTTVKESVNTKNDSIKDATDSKKETKEKATTVRKRSGLRKTTGRKRTTTAKKISAKASE